MTTGGTTSGDMEKLRTRGSGTPPMVIVLMKPQRPAQKGQAVGTGFIIDEKGWIVTNYHVAGKADEIIVSMISWPTAAGLTGRIL